MGALPDVQVVSLPRSAWEQDKTAVLEALNRADGVIKVDVQEQRQRKKRGMCSRPGASFVPLLTQPHTTDEF